MRNKRESRWDGINKPKLKILFFVGGVLSIVGALFLWCPDPPSAKEMMISYVEKYSCADESKVTQVFCEVNRHVILSKIKGEDPNLTKLVTSSLADKLFTPVLRLKATRAYDSGRKDWRHDSGHYSNTSMKVKEKNANRIRGCPSNPKFGKDMENNIAMASTFGIGGAGSPPLNTWTLSAAFAVIIGVLWFKKREKEMRYALGRLYEQGGGLTHFIESRLAGFSGLATATVGFYADGVTPVVMDASAGGQMALLSPQFPAFGLATLFGGEHTNEESGESAGFVNRKDEMGEKVLDCDVRRFELCCRGFRIASKNGSSAIERKLKHLLTICPAWIVQEAYDEVVAKTA